MNEGTTNYFSRRKAQTLAVNVHAYFLQGFPLFSSRSYSLSRNLASLSCLDDILDGGVGLEIGLDLALLDTLSLLGFSLGALALPCLDFVSTSFLSGFVEGSISFIFSFRSGSDSENFLVSETKSVLERLRLSEGLSVEPEG